MSPMKLPRGAAKRTRAERAADAEPTLVGGGLRERLRGTQLCRYFASGCRRGDACDYAHGDDALRRRPDLAKTRLCFRWQQGGCSGAENCRFAHGDQELRIGRAAGLGEARVLGAESPQALPPSPRPSASGGAAVPSLVGPAQSPLGAGCAPACAPVATPLDTAAAAAHVDAPLGPRAARAGVAAAEWSAEGRLWREFPGGGERPTSAPQFGSAEEHRVPGECVKMLSAWGQAIGDIAVKQLPHSEGVPLAEVWRLVLVQAMPEQYFD